jgi:hypothetical protein
VKQLTEADSAKRPLWPGGVMMREPLEIESSYRLANGTRKIYTTTTGWHPWRWTWSFDKMPFFYVNQLWTMRDWNKGTSSLTPSAIHLYPMIKEIGTEDLNTSAVPVDIESLSARRVMAPRGQLIGYTGTAVFVSAYNNESVGGFLSTMEGGEPLTDDMPI